MGTTRLRAQDGFIREILWLALTIAVIAVVLLDGMALFGTHQGAHDSASQAADEARTEYADSQSITAAKHAAASSVEANGDVMADFATVHDAEGMLQFRVTVKGTAETYGFKYLRYIPGMKKWVYQVSHPVAVESSQ